MKHQRPRVAGAGECYRCPEESAEPVTFNC